MSRFAKTLTGRVENYIALRRSLGYSFQKQASILRALVRYVDAEQIDGPLTQEMALNFVLSWGRAANGRVIRYSVTRGFAAYLAVYDPLTEALDPKVLPRSRAIPPPRILSEDELLSLLSACRGISPGYPARAMVLTPLVGLLASTGLRSGEVLRLDRADVDLTDGVLHIRKTKFRKDRLVPIHPTTLMALRDYVRQRDSLFPLPKEAAFFLSSRGNRLSPTGLQQAFTAACRIAGLDKGKSLRPHDLRHRFAVTRLAVWHGENADVQALLPILATYLGHARYSDTAYYITATADLLGMAAERAFVDGGVV
ncbi:tyrosine-type recombinase/integrase [Acidiphilium sp. PA]|uniref:tyrosine-type recombinase/integrase n=1 Tax=Acidiphilium sp. PA TaxID=2871705 RepID=UPI002243EAA0|nr:tyrosine-type recombinase/integrase [Acidiphilium sp. PA]MCW8309178.1 tyrosine-type recombinase/integrase [Acidiphilium sp. PA]